MKAGADVNVVDNVSFMFSMYLYIMNIVLFIQQRSTPLLLAVQNRHKSVIEMLIRCGADVSCVDNVS